MMARGVSKEKVYAGIRRHWMNLHQKDTPPFDEKHPYYLDELKDNLEHPMKDAAKNAYGSGSGNELRDKMCALHSSSALTFNLFGNDAVQLHPNKHNLTPGAYQVEYEKKLPALYGKANLDACLSSENELLLFEMKMKEWLFDRKSTVSVRYQSEEGRFRDKAFYNAWHTAAKDVAVDNAKKTVTESGKKAEPPLYIPKMQYVDVYQLMKHILGIYKGLFCTDELPKKKKVTLVLGVWTIEDADFFGTDAKAVKIYDAYQICEKEMRKEFAAFHDALAPIVQQFANRHVQFDVRLLTVCEIISALHAENRLQRYLC